MSDRMCKRRSPVKTCATVDFSIKSSWAFSAASQAFLSILFSEKVTSASFCIDKKRSYSIYLLDLCVSDHYLSLRAGEYVIP